MTTSPVSIHAAGLLYFFFLCECDSKRATSEKNNNRCHSIALSFTARDCMGSLT